MPQLLPRIVFTPGEPAGIGPDLAVKLAQREFAAEIIAVADPRLLQQRATRLQLKLNCEVADLAATPQPHRAGKLKILPVQLATTAQCGTLNAANSHYVLDTLTRAANCCLHAQADAMVTGPVHKGIINDAGIAFTGHTEYLAELSRRNTVVMMLMTKNLRVALVTTHLPLRAVPDAITPTHLEAVLRILQRDLRAQLGIANPRILVCGLNPHAGEGGHLGREDNEIVAPVVAKLRDEGFQLTGPVPADTAFIPKRLQAADVILAMYHDQGLPVLKYAGFGDAINMTLGLPFIRTSVDHGTALELAGTGLADETSLVAAIETAIYAAGQRNHE